MNWMWVYLDANGQPCAVLPPTAATTGFPSQGDAETYIGQTWRELVDGGVDAVTLYQDDRLVYGPMSLHP